MALQHDKQVIATVIKTKDTYCFSNIKAYISSAESDAFTHYILMAADLQKLFLIFLTHSIPPLDSSSVRGQATSVQRMMPPPRQTRDS